ncbi:hypothetical protein GGTG_03523 [Gaeumannomyces tritici R3-111a-1]|uniref:Asl1-like glycosyl hydrolase catalytic domain-containing protein n=1 Tax=Gaeumannomyces tritici (strain R3-111a-1) TaxID=644352 RepID=J3NQG6_GAET3|nr:hypothetical protein GGTG_03523 [Gaeumannomyces tritici R3-111a-1]EJT78422.1 hypothetical protein GGTG_03523 [Gaeumannomyces tritici R3-111a-1]
MHIPSTLLGLALPILSAVQPAAAQQPNMKRGLCYVPNKDYPQDNYVWTRPVSPLSWYYNYGPEPSVVFNNISQDKFEFVPMLWGAPKDPSDTTFLDTVRDLMNKKKVNITHVLTFNEPDGPNSYGGSDVQPAFAARVWIKNIIPLQEMGVKAGLPAPTGGWGGIPWLNQFLGNCSNLISEGGSKKNCTFDFVPIHWYGNFGGLASHIGTYAAAFPGKKMWVTEYNLNDQPLDQTQDFVKMSMEYMDRIADVERYSLFAAFRSHKSNVGPNASMLSAGGQLTDIGAMYLDKSATGVLPQTGGTSDAPSGRCSSGALRKATVIAGVVGILALAF